MTEYIGQQFGNYRLIKLVGRGGFAEVYLGEHVYLKTQAAIKVHQTQLVGENLDSFLKEARTIANLEHANILRVLDFGVHEGLPFLVMSYAPNGTLRQRYHQGTVLPLETIVSYVRQISSALQYVHNEKLIHRDIKPENLLLGRNNEILLSDFGIALISQSSRYDSTREIAGTVAYMSPEQIQGKPRPASDQYALGVIVYEWLSGQRPFQGGFTELCAQHMFATPPPLHEKTPRVSLAIEEVVMKALAKDPQERFPSVSEFANALERAVRLSWSHITPPVQPMTPPPPVPKPGNLLTPQTVSADSFNAVEPTVQAPKPGNPSPRPIQAPVTPILPLISTPGVPTPAPVTPLPTPTPSPPLNTPGEFAPDQLQQGRRTSRRAVLVGLGLAGLTVLAGGGAAAWVLTHRTPGGQQQSNGQPTPRTGPAVGTLIYPYHGHQGFVASVAWSPTGNRIASGSNDMTVQIWGALDGSNVFTYRRHKDVAAAVAWSPTGNRVASGSADHTVQVWDASDGGNVLIYAGHSKPVRTLAWSRDGRYIASGASDNTVQVWNAATGTMVYTYRNHTAEVRGVAWSRDGMRIASASFDHTVQVWDAFSGTNVLSYPGHSKAVHGLAWSHDGKYLASGSYDRTVQVWDASNGTLLVTFSDHTENVNAVAWSPDDSHIASGSSDKTVRVWDATTGANAFVYPGHTAEVYTVIWSSDGKLVASGGQDFTVQVWQAI